MSKHMTDAERQQLALKLDRELQSHLEESIAKSAAQPKEPEKSFEEQLEELDNHPAFMKEFDPSKPMSPAMEALQQLKYETEDDESNAEGYKDDGNDQFKKKKYRWAIDNYSKGISLKCTNRELNAVLYCNRAASHFYIQNYRSSFQDAFVALKFKPDHMKAIIRGVRCCLEINKHDEAIQWCDNGLDINPTEKTLLELRPKAVSLKAQAEKERRKQLAKERKEEAAETNLITLIKSRGVKLGGFSKKGSKSLLLDSVETFNPAGAKVFVDKAGVLHWPVMFVYPEYGETDMIKAFSENHRLEDHIESMFGPTAEPAPWDEESKYKAENIDVYFEDRDNSKLIRLKQSATLGDILKHDRYFVHGGTPGFILLVRNSGFANDFCARHK